MHGFTLHNYFRSSTSFRVRVALNFKGIEYAYQSYHLRKGEQRSSAMLDLSPQGLVPVLELPDGRTLTQSMAIIEWIDETCPGPPLLPSDVYGRARVRSLAQMVACEIHPINNLRVLKELETSFGADSATVATWFRKWVDTTFVPLEKRLEAEELTGLFCHGDTPTMADICLSAQVINNKRFSVDMTQYPTIARIHERCMDLEAYNNAKPELQPDAE